jgi:hypothetical protein
MFLTGVNPSGHIGKSRFEKNKLAEFDAFLAAGLSASSLLKVLLHDSLSVWAVVVIVVNLTVPRRFFD